MYANKRKFEPKKFPLQNRLLQQRIQIVFFLVPQIMLYNVHLTNPSPKIYQTGPKSSIYELNQVSLLACFSCSL